MTRTTPYFEESFAQQEAPIVDGAWVPQTLLAPLSIGRYAEWLRGQVTKKIDSDPVKAAKRALSLARITGYPEHGERVISALRAGTELVEVALEARRALLPHLGLLASQPSIQSGFRDALDCTMKRLEAQIVAREANLDGGEKAGQNERLEALKAAMRQLLDDIEQAAGAVHA
ncbi:MAG: hypothetical protein QM756_18580 [Polyangiaceae bacterium]